MHCTGWKPSGLRSLTADVAGPPATRSELFTPFQPSIDFPSTVNAQHLPFKGNRPSREPGYSSHQVAGEGVGQILSDKTYNPTAGNPYRVQGGVLTDTKTENQAKSRRNPFVACCVDGQITKENSSGTNYAKWTRYSLVASSLF